MTTEDERARAYRQKEQQQANNRAAANRRLRGSEIRRRSNLSNWWPIITRNIGWDPHDPLNGKEPK